ncbi:MAG: HlyD family efflux transporter periplasmic adaptor subunit [Planctomycetaceae bacterium]
MTAISTILIGILVFPTSEQSTRKPAPIVVHDVQLTVIQQVDLPAMDEGVLADIAIRVGQMVKRQEVLARLNDERATMAVERARIELQIAEQDSKNDTHSRLAKKILAVAESELQRAKQSNVEFANSVSQTEIDELQLKTDQAAIQIEQASHELRQAELTRKLKNTEFQIANRILARRQIRASLNGQIVQIYRQPGEWVKPGEPVARILRLDRLRVEGFLKADRLTPQFQDAPIVLTVALPETPRAQFVGRIVFVSPEINPVDGQVRFWAEVDNRNLSLKPGMVGEVSIQPTQRTATP